MTQFSSEIYNVLIVDDEAPARALLEEYCCSDSRLQVVGSCPNAIEAQNVLDTVRVDVLLCDVRMPKLSGLEFVRTLSKSPAVIFTTAYSQYAVDGFDLNVTDYLLKPISLPRFQRAIEKVITPSSTVLNVKADRKMYRLSLDEILFLESQHEYVTYHTLTQKITSYGSLKALEGQLPSPRFVRIHKSYIVATDKIERVERGFVCIGNRMLPIGRLYKDNLPK